MGVGRSAAPHRTAPHRTAPHRTAPHRETTPHRTAPDALNDIGAGEVRLGLVADDGAQALLQLPLHYAERVLPQGVENVVAHHDHGVFDGVAVQDLAGTHKPDFAVFFRVCAAREWAG
jgi:hypothetical protein